MDKDDSIGSWYFWGWLGIALLIGAVLRLWGLIWGQPLWHPDEFNFVYWPLLFFEGDLNPGVFYYPHLLYYLLALVYGLFFVGHWLISGWDINQSAALYYFWRADDILHIGRLVCALFGVGTIVWIGLIARRVYGTAAGVLAGGFAAVAVLGVRQAPLAAADVPMTFFFCAAVWTALRLLEKPTYRDYAIAGLCVGLAAATKYHGAIAAAAVCAAHWQARRPLFDTRLWMAGLLSLAVFVATSPYLLIDYGAFRAGLTAVAEHTAAGRGDLGPAWWYHLHFTLRHNLGWLGGGLTFIGIAVAWRNPQGRILLVGCSAYYLLISAGQLVFVRYALPVAALQCVLAAGALVPLARHRLGLLVAGLALCQPLYNASRVAHLLAATDTRTQARQWIEHQVPSGSTLGNFGGWAGDPQVETFEHLWWRVQRFEAERGYLGLEEHLSFFAAQAALPPYYHYAVQYGNRQQRQGDMDLIADAACTFAILHEHPLGSSRIDDAFAVGLAQEGTLAARFAPTGQTAAPAYDPIDAYYIPLGSFGPLQSPGPDIEIWRVGNDPPPQPPLTPLRALGGAYMSGAFASLDQGDPLGFQHLAARALSLDPDRGNAGYHLKAGAAQRRLGFPHQALRLWQRAAELDTARAEPHYNIGLVYHYDLGDEETAIRHWRHALALEPDHVPSHGQIAATLRRRGDYRQAAAHWQRVVALDPDNADAFYNLGLVFRYDLQDAATALSFWRQTVALDTTHWDARYNLALGLYQTGDHPQALDQWQQVVALRPDHPQGHNGLGTAYKALGRYREAVAAWKQAVLLAPDYATAHFNLGLTYLHHSDRPTEARTHLRQVLKLQPDHPQAAQIRTLLDGD